MNKIQKLIFAGIAAVSFVSGAYAQTPVATPFGLKMADGKTVDDMIEPSGVSFGYYGCAVGKGQQAAQSEIEKLDVIKKKEKKEREKSGQQGAKPHKI